MFWVVFDGVVGDVEIENIVVVVVEECCIEVGEGEV